MNLYKCIFWITEAQSEQYFFRIPCNSMSDITGTTEYPLCSKDGTNYNHKILWSLLPKSLTGNKPFDYFPRGRVEIRNANQPIPKKKRDVESEITALRSKTAIQEREIEIRGRDQQYLFQNWQEDKKRADRNESSAVTLLNLQKYAPEELAHAQQAAAKRKAHAQKSPPTPAKRNWWTK